MAKMLNNFGGNWTEAKLEVLGKYLSAYAKILKSVGYYKFAYIDAFAGTGYVRNKAQKNTAERLPFLELDDEAEEYIKGSAKVALECEPKFDKYIFIELDKQKTEELQAVVDSEHSELKDRVKIENDDANKVIQNLCVKDWTKHRAVIFLDPFGMEVEWETIVKIAETEAIDLWVLFPLGVSVNRLLMKKGDKIRKSWSDDLDKIFGTHDWFDRFYSQKREETLFGESETITKEANFDKIASFYIERLKEIFAGVVEEPLYLYNSTNNPIFLLCFASGNKKGSRPAIKIAKDIIGKML